MKYFILIFFTLLLVLSCRDNKKETPQPMAVEPNNGIGDGAPPLDSLLNNETPQVKSGDTLIKP
tara:strand:+ start:154321 stop:154512 length:192 start_codon:yes stop_codon:yes gene_type:complete